MINHVEFKNDPSDPYYKGRNGDGKCRGLEIWNSTADLVVIEPINSKGNIANCVITFPKNKLEEVIEALKKLRDQPEPKKKGK